MANLIKLGNHKALGGNNVSHSKRRTKRTFKPNLVKATMMVNGAKRRILLPARMLKTLNKVAK